MWDGGWVEGYECCGHAISGCNWNSSQQMGDGAVLRGTRRCRHTSRACVMEEKPGHGGWGMGLGWGTGARGVGTQAVSSLSAAKMQGLP